MNAVALVFSFILYALLKSMIVSYFDPTQPIEDDVTIELPSFPVFSINETEMDELFSFKQLGGEGIEIVKATQNIAIAVADTGIIILAILKYLIGLIVFLALLVAFIVANAFTGIEGAPAFINVLLVTPAVVMLGIIIYKLVRSGEDEA